MNIAIIPARGGSKRIPRKNIKEFCGKPMIAWSIEAAISSGLFEHVIISTDDPEIARIAKIYGGEVPFVRPANLAGDYVVVGDVVKHAFEWAIKKYKSIDYICSIYATAPFIRPQDLVLGLELLKVSQSQTVFPVTSFPYPIQRAIKVNSENRLEMFYPEHYLTRSQDLPIAYHDAGQFYWLTKDLILSPKNDLPKLSTPLILPRNRVQDIDTEEDWLNAEILFKVLNSD